METPEQYIPGMPIENAWEACITMGTQWQYKPTNETYKPGGELIRLLVETRAKGGNLLLNVGPKPDGELPIEQEERLREIALWMFVNGEAIYGVRPWVITNEGPVWFTRSKGGDALYAIVFQTEPWRYGTWRELVLRSVAAGDSTRISVLGQNDGVLEYRPEVVPRTTWEQRPDGLHIRAMRAQRLYNDRAWPNPVVLKITGARPAFTPPRVRTAGGRRTAAGRTLVLEGELESLGQGGSVEVGFQYRPVGGFDVNVRATPWTDTGFLARRTPGRYSVEAGGLDPRERYEFRAVARHALLTVYGREARVEPE
jgi:alpha-L-fucosidase